MKTHVDRPDIAILISAIVINSVISFESAYLLGDIHRVTLDNNLTLE